MILGMTLALSPGNLVVEKYMNTLVITNIQEVHSDVYTCIVENIIGKASASSKITVIPKGKQYSVTL